MGGKTLSYFSPLLLPPAGGHRFSPSPIRQALLASPLCPSLKVRFNGARGSWAFTRFHPNIHAWRLRCAASMSGDISSQLQPGGPRRPEELAAESRKLRRSIVFPNFRHISPPPPHHYSLLSFPSAHFHRRRAGLSLCSDLRGARAATFLQHRATTLQIYFLFTFLFDVMWQGGSVFLTRFGAADWIRPPSLFLI